jgi:hypothetical protein
MKTRANVTLEADAYSFASAYASAKGLPLGAAISELILRAEKIPEQPSSRLKTDEQGLLVVSSAGMPITPEMVKSGSEDAFE